jgi:DnaK suppressor protein
MADDIKVRYSDEDLAEFKALIEQKILKSKEELAFTQQEIVDLSETGFNQQNGDMYDDSGAHFDLEFKQRLATRQQKYIDDLQKALYRIQNKTYGICTVTGNLIPKERLRVVPHATKTVDGKIIANKNIIPPGAEIAASDPFLVEETKKPLGKPVGDKVRIPNTKRPASAGDDWEPDNETIEDAGYRARKNDEEDN